MQHIDGGAAWTKAQGRTAHAIFAHTTTVSILRSLAGKLSRVAENLRCLDLKRREVSGWPRQEFRVTWSTEERRRGQILPPLRKCMRPSPNILCHFGGRHPHGAPYCPQRTDLDLRHTAGKGQSRNRAAIFVEDRRGHATQPDSVYLVIYGEAPHTSFRNARR